MVCSVSFQSHTVIDRLRSSVRCAHRTPCRSQSFFGLKKSGHLEHTDVLRTMPQRL